MGSLQSHLGTNSALSRHSSGLESTLIPQFPSTTFALLSSTKYLVPTVLCPPHPYHLSPIIPASAPPQSSSWPQWLTYSLVSYCFARLCGKVNGNWQVVLAHLLVRSVLWARQREMTCIFLYNSTFRQADCFACCYFAWLILRP
jgi:hypothetical protein